MTIAFPEDVAGDSLTVLLHYTSTSVLMIAWLPPQGSTLHLHGSHASSPSSQ